MARSPLPSIGGRADYLLLQRDADLWLPAARVICERHGISSGELARLGEGTNVVFAAGARYILKLFPPFWENVARAEAAVAERVHGKLGIATPEVVARGELNGWPYLITTRLAGISLGSVWDSMDREAQLDIVVQLGELLARLHALPVTGLDPLFSDWPARIHQWSATCVERRREQGLAESWLRQIPGFLAKAAPLYPSDFAPAIVTGDAHQYHLLVSNAGGSWTLSGYFDFDDAMIGFREYDLAAPGVFMMAHLPDLLRTFLLAYGYSESFLDEALARRLMAYTLLHRYRDLTWLLHELVRDPSCSTLEDLTHVFYGMRG